MSDGWHGKAKYDAKVDIYAYGIMLWNLWTGEKDPYSHVASHAALMRHLAGGGRPTFPTPVGDGGGGGGGGGGCVAEVAALAARCWAERPQDRPSFVDIDRDMAMWGSGGDVLRQSGGGGGGGGGGAAAVAAAHQPAAGAEYAAGSDALDQLQEAHEQEEQQQQQPQALHAVHPIGGGFAEGAVVAVAKEGA